MTAPEPLRVALSEGEAPEVQVTPGLTGDDALADLHAKYHCEDGNMLYRDDCAWESCAFWEVAEFVAPPLLAARLAATDRDTTHAPKFGYPKCVLCGDDLVWHPGNGGQWIGAHPPRDWMHCNGSAAQDAPRHRAPLGVHRDTALRERLLRLAAEWDEHARVFTSERDARIREDWEHVAATLRAVLDPAPHQQADAELGATTEEHR